MLEILAVFAMKFNVALVVNLITSHDRSHWSATKKTNVYFVAKQWMQLYNVMKSWLAVTAKFKAENDFCL